MAPEGNNTGHLDYSCCLALNASHEGSSQVREC